MKSRIIILLFFTGVLLIFNANTAKAQVHNDDSGNFGVGVMLGEPTGISVKSWLSDKAAFDVGAAWSLSSRDDAEALHLHADLLLHSWFNNTQDLAFYYGVGGRIIFADKARAGIRVPLGLDYVFESIPFDLFVEAAPILDLAPEVALAGNGAVGIRYYF